MAGKSRFRVPSLSEMEKSGHETSTTVRPLFQSSMDKKKADPSEMSKSGSSDAASSSSKKKFSLASKNSHMPLPSPSPQGRVGKRSLASLKSFEPLPSPCPEKIKPTSKPSQGLGSDQSKVKASSQQWKKLSTSKNSSQLKSAAAAAAAAADSSEVDDEKSEARDLYTQFPGARSFLSSRTASNSTVPALASTSKSSSAATKSESSAMKLSAAASEVRPTEFTSASELLTSSVMQVPASLPCSSAAETDNKGEASAKAKDVDLENLPTLAKLGKTNSVVVNPRQRGNPIIKHIRNVPWEYGNILADYVMGQAACALFLSLRYHQLNPTYIHERLRQLGRSFDLRVLLVQVDIKEPHHLVKELAKICILADCTLILAFSAEEAGRYLESYKIYENKPPDAIMEKTETDFMSKLTDCLTTVKSINKTDCATLMSSFGSLETIMKASEEDLSMCPGFGPQKAKRLHEVFHEPFLKIKKRKLPQEQSTSNAETPT